MQQSESLGLLLDHTQDKIALVEPDGTFTYVNQAVERILGFEPSELVGENAFAFMHPADVDDVGSLKEADPDAVAEEVDGVSAASVRDWQAKAD